MNRIELLLVQAVLVLGATVPGPPVCAQEEEEESSELALLSLDVGIMRLSSASPSDQRSFVVTGETWVDVHVRASAGGLNVAVLGPGGETIDESTVGSFGGSYVELDGAETSASLFPGLVSDQPTYHYIFRVPLEPPLVAGTYDVQVTVIDGAGGVGTDLTTDELTINAAPAADADGPYVIDEGDDVVGRAHEVIAPRRRAPQ